jgi:hypothetical protein
MAKKSSSSLFSMALLGIGAYLAYENWPALSAMFTPAAAAPAAAVPASAGTLVSTAAPAAAVTPAAAAVVPASAGTLVATPPAAAAPAAVVPATAGTVVAAVSTPAAPVATSPTSDLVRAIPIVNISPGRFPLASAPNTAQLQAQIAELQDELRQSTNANGFTNEDRQDLHRQISALQAQL